jgi:hypothetical protein
MVGVLDRIRANVPRVMVNLIAYFPLDQVYDAIESSMYCRLVQRVANMCAIIFAPPTPQARADFANRTQALNQRLIRIADRYQKMGDPGFTVIAQTGLERLNIGALKRDSYLTRVDWCVP